MDEMGFSTKSKASWPKRCSCGVDVDSIYEMEPFSMKESSKTKILVIDDEESIRHYLKLLLEREDFQVDVAGDGDEGLQAVQGEEYEIILCDLRMPTRDGLAFLEEFRRRPCLGEVVMMSAYGSRDTALEAVRRGAYDYIDKPIQRDELLLVIHKLLEREKLRKENRRLQIALIEGYEDEGIIGVSESLKRVLAMARRAAKFPSTVLVTGENGTGKELIARAVHRWSERQSKEFVAINSGSIPENLLESELFGYQRGAFTGAHKDHAGLFEAAHQGTLFLDEIAEIPLQLQVKLLRVLQEGQIRRIGEAHPRTVDVRIIAATNKDLQKEVNEGRFREDLFYRLNVVRLDVPPLRERAEDIPLLLDFYIKRVNACFGTHLDGVAPEAMRSLLAYEWRGNVRELKNVVEQAAVLEESGRLTLDTLPSHIITPDDSSPGAKGDWLAHLLGDDLSIKRGQKALERVLIRRALQETEGNRSAAARILEISHRALLYKIKDYDIV